jgi:2'-5' RNA ligase
MELKSPKPIEKSPHEFASTQINLPGDLAKKVIAAGKLIPDSDLAEDGREDEPHVTVKFGLHDDDPKPLKSLLAQQEGPVVFALGKTSLFENDEFDVVKVEVISHDLHHLNDLISENCKHTDTHPGYKPHVTIAYVKPGTGKKYVNKDFALKGEVVETNEILLSTKDRKMIPIPVGGRLPRPRPISA